MIAAEAPDLALDAALLVRALDARRGELRAEQVVRAQRDEPVGLDAPPSPEDLLDRRAQVVEADLLKDATEPLERLDVELEERPLGLDQRCLTERRARERRAHQEQMHARRDARQLDLRLAPVDLRQNAGCVDLRDEHLADRPAHRALSGAHVVADRRLGDVGAVLVDQPPPDPLRRVALLTRRLAVGLKPRVDQRAIRAKPRRRPALRRTLRRRHRRDQRLPDRPPVHAVTLRQRPDRQPLAVAVAPDLLEQLHPGSHPFRRLPLELEEARTVGRPSDGGGTR